MLSLPAGTKYTDRIDVNPQLILTHATPHPQALFHIGIKQTTPMVCQY